MNGVEQYWNSGVFDGLKAILAAFLVVLVGASSGHAQAVSKQADVLAVALDAAERGKWDKAEALARQVGDPAAVDVVIWMHLRDGSDDWSAYRAFLRRNSDWPGLGLLRIKGEAAIPQGADPAQVIAYFAHARPRTGTGITRLVQALKATGRNSLAEKEAIRAWRGFSLKKDEQAWILANFGKSLAKHHQVRLDMLLWRGLRRQAESMFPLVSKDYVRLAKARLALRGKRRGVDALIAAVPAKLKDDAGLAYERFLWRYRKGLYDAARDLLIERSVSVAKLGRPEKWANRRRAIARQEMRDGRNRKAYVIAANHFLEKGSDYADLEWLAGYIALRKFNNPERALMHFKNFKAAVATPISYGRAGYWLGRAYEALGDKKAAHEAYAFGARYQTSFYGQLAAERINAPPDPRLAGHQKTPGWRSASFAGSPLLHVAMLLHQADRPRLAEMFIRKLGAKLDAQGLQQLADMAMDIGRPNIAVRLSKQAARKGHVLPRTYFPVTELAKLEFDIAPEVAMAIARRESELDPLVISPAGARGLMQVMPRTARKMTKALGIRYSRSKLTDDWKYNARIGTAYLAQQLKDFNGSYILAFAAYNAGPHRVKRWIECYGDPRRDDVDQVDWIEHIPFRETRNYVMRVIESLYVYRARLAGKTPPHRISKDLKRG